MTFCIKCGLQLGATQQLCPRCGTRPAPAAQTSEVIHPRQGQEKRPGQPSCQACGGEMRKKRVARHSQIGALFVLFLGFIFSVFGLFTFGLSLLFGIPLLILGLYLGMAIRHLWVCRSCGASIERQAGIRPIHVVGAIVAVIILLGLINVFTAAKKPSRSKPIVQDTRGGTLYTTNGGQYDCERIIEELSRVKCEAGGASFGIQRELISRIERR